MQGILPVYSSLVVKFVNRLYTLEDTVALE